ncbi:hypothetical protein H4Q26_014767 [Puccinia striiformis f. sp. tritici PST-130]|nr:hypothetical protein H4Q26_014767 [Puccinia striiformis f. sp. tritici PST-130]
MDGDTQQLLGCGGIPALKLERLIRRIRGGPNVWVEMNRFSSGGGIGMIGPVESSVIAETRSSTAILKPPRPHRRHPIAPASRGPAFSIRL